jgi:hypothetical protein
MEGWNAIPTPVPCVFFPYNIHVHPTHTSSLSPLPSPTSLLPLGAVQGVPPATVAEWTLQGDGNKDFYDGARETFLPIPPPLIRKPPD